MSEENPHPTERRVELTARVQAVHSARATPIIVTAREQLVPALRSAKELL